MVETHNTVKHFSSQDTALEYIISNYDVCGSPIEKFAVSAEGINHSSPAISYEVENEKIRYVHALSSGHVVVRHDKDSGRGYGPHSDQKSTRGSSGHPR